MDDLGDDDVAPVLSIVTVIGSDRVAVMESCVIGTAPGMPEQIAYAASNCWLLSFVHSEATHLRAPSPSAKPVRLLLVHRQL